MQPLSVLIMEGDVEVLRIDEFADNRVDGLIELLQINGSMRAI